MMFITTILASLAFLMAFDIPVLYLLPFFLVFGFIDCVFLSSNLFKVILPFPFCTFSMLSWPCSHGAIIFMPEIHAFFGLPQKWSQISLEIS